MSMKRPSKVGAYAPDKLLFRSYFGALWRGTKDGDDQEKAIRVVDTDALSDDEAAEAAKAAKATVGFEAPGIYTLREVIEDDGLALVSDAVEGDTVRTLLRQLSVRRKLVPFDVIAKMAVDLCDAVDALHSCAGALEEAISVGYGGITPDAFVVGSDGTTRLLEPGIEAVLSRSKAYQHHAKRLGYDAPELLEGGSTGPASDVFTIGAIIWELVSGKRLMPGATLEVVSRRWKEGPLPRADASKRLGKEDVPGDLADVLAQALAVEPGARFGSPSAMREAIGDLDLSVADASAVVEMVQGVAPRRGATAGRGLGRRSATLVGVGGTPGVPAFKPKIEAKAADESEEDAEDVVAGAEAAETDAEQAPSKADAEASTSAEDESASDEAGDAAEDAGDEEAGTEAADDAADDAGAEDEAAEDAAKARKTLPKPSPRKVPLPTPKPKAKLPIPPRKGPPRFGAKPGVPPRRKPGSPPGTVGDDESGIVDELSMSELDSAPPPAKRAQDEDAEVASPLPGATAEKDDLDVDVALSDPPPESEPGDQTLSDDEDEPATDQADEDAGPDGASDAEDDDGTSSDAEEGDADEDEGGDDEDDEQEKDEDEDDVAAVGGGLFADAKDDTKGEAKADLKKDEKPAKAKSAAATAGGLIEPTSAVDADLAPAEDGSKRNVVIAAIAIAAALILYVMFSGGDEGDDPGKPATTAPPTETAAPAPPPAPEPIPEPEPVVDEVEDEPDAGAEEEEEEEEVADEPEPKATPPVAAAPRPRPVPYPRPRPQPAAPKPKPKPSTYVPDDI